MQTRRGSLALRIEQDSSSSSSSGEEEEVGGGENGDSFSNSNCELSPSASNPHLRDSGRKLVPNSRSTFFAKLMSGSTSSVPATGILGIPTHDRDSGVSEKLAEPSLPSEPCSTRVSNAGSIADQALPRPAATPPPTPCTRVLARASATASIAYSKLPRLAESCCHTMLTALPIAILSYATITTYALMIVEGSDLPRELVVSIQLFSSVVSGIFLALTSECPQTIASSDVSIALFYQAPCTQPPRSLPPRSTT